MAGVSDSGGSPPRSRRPGRFDRRTVGRLACKGSNREDAKTATKRAAGRVGLHSSVDGDDGIVSDFSVL
jgi:hypothetical protein